MINSMLMPVFKEATGRDFNIKNKDDQSLMQSIIFLAHEKGIRIGDYDSFSQGEALPFSIGLKYDILDLQLICGEITCLSKLSEDMKTGLADIKRCFAEKPVVYDEKYWLECIATATYINHYVKRYSASIQEIEDYLVWYKPYMRCAEDNRKAVAFAIALFERK